MLADLLLPRCCMLCATAGTGLCRPCAATLPPAPDVAPPPGLERCWALLEYRDATRDLVAALKYRNRRDGVPELGAGLGELLAQLAAGRDRPVVSWCPTTARHRRARGYDQAELLARAAGRAAGLPVRRLLRRHPGAPQTGRSRAERLEGPRFAARRPGRAVVLVDDVRTTGATLAAAAAALRERGCQSVDGLTLAVRP